MSLCLRWPSVPSAAEAPTYIIFPKEEEEKSPPTHHVHIHIVRDYEIKAPKTCWARAFWLGNIILTPYSLSLNVASILIFLLFSLCYPIIIVFFFLLSNLPTHPSVSTLTLTSQKKIGGFLWRSDDPLAPPDVAVNAVFLSRILLFFLPIYLTQK